MKLFWVDLMFVCLFGRVCYKRLYQLILIIHCVLHFKLFVLYITGLFKLSFILKLYNLACVLDNCINYVVLLVSCSFLNMLYVYFVLKTKHLFKKLNNEKKLRKLEKCNSKNSM